ncbi:MAG: hypothetical protein JHC95_11550 [Solirubrobacteraceae bacterium]|nr:hypothetical protein [Solirubrobacteraceae bacterium]
MSSAAAGTAWPQFRQHPGRPSGLRVFGVIILALLIESFVTRLVAFPVPGLLESDGSDRGNGSFTPDGTASALANGAWGVVQVAAVVGLLWLLLPKRPARVCWIRVALTIGLGYGTVLLVAELDPLLALITAIAIVPTLRWAVYTEVGGVRAPLAPRHRRLLAVLSGALVGACLAGTVAYGLLHPIEVAGIETRQSTTVAKTPLEVTMPWMYNKGITELRVLAIEPGEQQGKALRLASVRIMPDFGWHTRPFTPFELRAGNDDSPAILLRFSRAGCTPGASSRVESVRIRYDLYGERTMAIPLDPPLLLHC